MDRLLTLAFWVLFVLTGVTSLIWLKQHMVAGTFIASACIVFGMWLERWNIIVPTLSHPYLIEWTEYLPTMTEWVLMIASFALLALMLLVLFKVFPPVSIWEVSEGRVIEEAKSKIEIPMPEPSLTARERRRRVPWADRAHQRQELSMHPGATEIAQARATIYFALAESMAEPLSGIEGHVTPCSRDRRPGAGFGSESQSRACPGRNANATVTGTSRRIMPGLCLLQDGVQWRSTNPSIVRDG